MFEVIWEKEAEEDLSRIDRTTAKKIRDKVENILPRNPRMGKALTGEWKGCYRITYGNYRIIYEIHETQLIVVVVKAEHRSTFYQGKRRYSTFTKSSITNQRSQAQDHSRKVVGNRGRKKKSLISK